MQVKIYACSKNPQLSFHEHVIKLSCGHAARHAHHVNSQRHPSTSFRPSTWPHVRMGAQARLEVGELQGRVVSLDATGLGQAAQLLAAQQEASRLQAQLKDVQGLGLAGGRESAPLCPVHACRWQVWGKKLSVWGAGVGRWRGPGKGWTCRVWASRQG